MKVLYKAILLCLILVCMHSAIAWGGENLSNLLTKYYPMNQSSGDLIDYLGYYNIPVNLGDPVEQAVGINGYGVNFTGDNDRYMNTNAWTPTAKGTFCMWHSIYTPRTGDMSSGAYLSGTNGDWYYGMHTGNKPYWVFTCGGSGDTINGDIAMAAGTNANPRWYLICIEWNDVTGGKMYVNGTLQADNIATKTCPIGATKLPVGAEGWPGAADFYYEGVLDELMIWNRSLTADEHAHLYNNATGMFPPFTAPGGGGQIPTITQSTYNCTSCLYNNGTSNQSAWRQNVGVNVTSRDRTPTISFSTDVNSNCRINRSNSNYTQMSATSNCETTGTTAHVCSLGASQAYSYGAGNTSIYVGCQDLVGSKENTTSTSGRLNLDLDLYQIQGFILKKDATAYSGAWIQSVLQRSNISVASTNSSTNGYYALEAYRNIWSVCALDPTNTSQNMNCSAWVIIA